MPIDIDANFLTLANAHPTLAGICFVSSLAFVGFIFWCFFGRD